MSVIFGVGERKRVRQTHMTAALGQAYGRLGGRVNMQGRGSLQQHQPS